MAEEILANRYRLDRILGAGGMATVYRAYDLLLDRPVAIKVLRAQGGFSQHEREEFLREARIVAGLNHPNIIAVHDAGIAGGMPFLVMELLSGVTLRQRLLDGPLAAAEGLRVTRRLAGALQTAHQRGILHLDVKPENVIFSASDEPKLSDFGISRALGEDPARPDGTLLGTPAYLAPEYVTGRPLDARADVYSLGVVLYELLTGKLPFVGETPQQQVKERLARDPIAPHALNPAIPEGLEQIMLKVLARNPAERYASMTELTQALEDYERLAERRTETLRAAELGASILGAGATRPLPRTTIQLEPPAQRPLERLATPPAPAPAPAPSPAPSPTRPAPVAESRPSGAPAAPQVRQPATRRRRVAAIALLLLLAGLGSLLAARALTGQEAPASAGEAVRPSQRPASTSRPPASGAALDEATAEPSATNPPSPTEAPPTELPAPPTAAPVEPTAAPIVAEPPAAPAAEPAPPTPAPYVAPVQGGASAVVLDDSAWVGGYNQPRSYGGRTAMWIYGYATRYSVMATTFSLAGQPSGTASLTVVGMDSENWPKTPISIMVNGIEIYNGPNPLPDDDEPLATGTWGSYSWSFDAALLKAGDNVISIANLDEGAFSLPPFFMLDYAEVRY